jgi:hypothetical protein
MIGIMPVGLNDRNNSVFPEKPRHIVNMPVGVVTVNAFSQPENLFNTIIFPQVLTDLILREIRIAVFMEKTGSCCQSSSCAIEFDGPSFHDDPRVKDRNIKVFTN